MNVTQAPLFLVHVEVENRTDNTVSRLCNRKNAKMCTLAGMKELLYEVRCLKSNGDMILALAGQFKQLSHEPEKFR